MMTASQDLAPPVARDSLRDVIANDKYAATFSSTAQYRSAILQHIDNADAAHLVAVSTHDADRADAEWSAAITTAQMVYSDVPDALQAIDYLVALRTFAKGSGKPIPAPPRPRAEEPTSATFSAAKAGGYTLSDAALDKITNAFMREANSDPSLPADGMERVTAFDYFKRGWLAGTPTA